ncbi:MAG: NAD(P)H-dependent oxidoreductase [Clostridium sp.]|uniref:flavodoxin family protein n=1 Tax=Clostridium sp. TaxID=1506 RepID=UPI0039E772CA
MKYLMFNGSPHKGNTWRLAKLIQEDLQEISPESIFEEIQLADLELPFCTGCSLCFRRGHEHCPHHKIMQKIIDKIDESDGVIFAMTTFNMQPNALTKNFIDHLCYMLHRPHFFRNKAIAVTTVGGVGGKSAVNYLMGWLKGIGFNHCYKFPMPSYSWNDYTVNKKTKIKCKKLVEKFHKDVSSKKMYAPTFAVLIPYNLFRGMSLGYAKGTEYETEDGVYWINPLRSKSTYDPLITVPFYKKAFGSVFYVIGKTASKFVTITYKK